MTKPILLPALALLALAGCQSGGEATGNAAADTAAESNAVVDNGDAGNNVAAQVIAMNDAQRNVVFIRAIMDAGLTCEHVDKSERLPDQDGNPLWRANCQGGAAHMITITPDGTAKIVSRTDR
ncbi:hypothetical protein ACNFJ7_07355 [Sphingomonas sp. HT-1]|jgi:hypothetical protein|uniref:hypothetical protein n=1 Tax=unclassified Sphingomonas TaxID=196159 RepID=UPI0003165EA3|nr:MULTISPECIES: hypothetical protein [unclassified Sphingomonas]KTF68412.1 hypothetical protein ATB93_13920 [Sphingomonas sp. WG]